MCAPRLVENVLMGISAGAENALIPSGGAPPVGGTGYGALPYWDFFDETLPNGGNLLAGAPGQGNGKINNLFLNPQTGKFDGTYPLRSLSDLKQPSWMKRDTYLWNFGEAESEKDLLAQSAALYQKNESDLAAAKEIEKKYGYPVVFDAGVSGAQAVVIDPDNVMHIAAHVTGGQYMKREAQAAVEQVEDTSGNSLDKALNGEYNHTSENPEELDGKQNHLDVGEVGSTFSTQSAKKASKKDSKSTKSGRKPYEHSRPPFAKGQVDAVWEYAASMNPEGKVFDVSGKEILWNRTKPRNGQWDMGHIPSQKYSRKHEEYMAGKITTEEFRKWYQNPKHYRPELPHSNRSHIYEKEEAK